MNRRGFFGLLAGALAATKIKPAYAEGGIVGPEPLPLVGEIPSQGIVTPAMVRGWDLVDVSLVEHPMCRCTLIRYDPAEYADRVLAHFLKEETAT